MLKPGDKVVMNDRYHVSEENKGKIWTVTTDPWNCCGTMVVKLVGKSGGYAVDGLDKVDVTRDLPDCLQRLSPAEREVHRLGKWHYVEENDRGKS